MKIVAFLQLYNELEKGNLIRTLDNCRKWADEIVIYDDCSTDGSQDVYSQYTPHVIHGKVREFKREIFHKKELLALALSLNPDWIGWMDGDAIFDNACTNGKLRELAAQGDRTGVDGYYFHYTNMWRDPCYFRLDNGFNALHTCAFWKNNGNLHYNPTDGLHQTQWPAGMRNVQMTPYQILHYGFASYENIVYKYLTYKSHGQRGWDLDRLIDEKSSYQLEKVPLAWFPPENLPVNYHNCSVPLALDYNEVRDFNNVEEYRNAKNT